LEAEAPPTHQTRLKSLFQMFANQTQLQLDEEQNDVLYDSQELYEEMDLEYGFAIRDPSKA
jgi:hypothetical protein